MVAASERKTLNSPPPPRANSSTHRCREQLFRETTEGWMNSSDQQTRERDRIEEAGKPREPSTSCKNSLARGALEHHGLQPLL